MLDLLWLIHLQVKKILDNKWPHSSSRSAFAAHIHNNDLSAIIPTGWRKKVILYYCLKLYRTVPLQPFHPCVLNHYYELHLDKFVGYKIISQSIGDSLYS